MSFVCSILVLVNKSVAPVNNNSYLCVLTYLVPCRSCFYCVSTQHQECNVVVIIAIGPLDVVDSTNRLGPLTTLSGSSVQSMVGVLQLPSETSRGKHFLKTSQVCKQEGDFALINAVAKCFLASVTWVWVEPFSLTTLRSRRCSATSTVKIPQSYPLSCRGQSLFSARLSKSAPDWWRHWYLASWRI